MIEEMDGVAQVESAVRIDVAPPKAPALSDPERRPQPFRISLAGRGCTHADVGHEVLGFPESEDQILAAHLEGKPAQGLVLARGDAQNLRLGALPDGFDIEGRSNPGIDD